MTIDWLTPAALAGLLLLAVPLAVHLFARAPVRRVVVPSLRPVAPGRLRVRRRRYVRHPWLLLVRLSIVAAAVAAAAGPLAITPGRRAAWAARTARAVVVDRGLPASMQAAVGRAIAAEDGGAAAVEVFGADPVDASLPLALAWLDRQGPSGRELVVIGDAASAPGAAALARVPSHIGVRLLTLEEGAAGDQSRLWIGADADGRILARRWRATDSAAGSIAIVDEPMPRLPVSVRTRGEDQDRLTAIWEGVVADGAFLRAPAAWRTIDLEWTTALTPDGVTPLEAADRALLWPLATALGRGAPSAAEAAPWTGVAPEVSAARRGEALVLRVAAPVETRHAAAVLRAALAVAAGERALPRAVRWLTAAQRAALERPAGAVPADTARFASERDGRWLWAAVVVLLVVEMAVRRRVTAPRAAADEGTP